MTEEIYVPEKLLPTKTRGCTGQCSSGETSQNQVRSLLRESRKGREGGQKLGTVGTARGDSAEDYTASSARGAPVSLSRASAARGGKSRRRAAAQSEARPEGTDRCPRALHHHGVAQRLRLHQSFFEKSSCPPAKKSESPRGR